MSSHASGSAYPKAIGHNDGNAEDLPLEGDRYLVYYLLVH